MEQRVKRLLAFTLLILPLATLGGIYHMGKSVVCDGPRPVASANAPRALLPLPCDPSLLFASR